MEYGDFSRVVVCAKEAGAGAFLAALLDDRSRGFQPEVYAYPAAARFFESAGVPHQEVTDVGPAESILARSKPDAVFLGATVGFTMERAFLVAAQKLGIPVFSFVDHYWNVWQRFAHEDTAARWHYLPDKIYVMDENLRKHALALGAPANRVGVVAHPVLMRLASATPTRNATEVKRDLAIAASDAFVLIASEYVFENSPLWQWEQPTPGDLVHMVRSTLVACRDASASTGRRHVVVLKLHPSETTDWTAVLSEFDPSSYRVSRDPDKLSLLDAALAVVGLNSMLLLEALARKRPVFSIHERPRPLDSWLSSINSNVVELSSSAELRDHLTKLARSI